MQLLLHFEIQNIKMSPAPSPLCARLYIYNIMECSENNIAEKKNNSGEQTTTVEIARANESFTRERILLYSYKYGII